MFHRCLAGRPYPWDTRETHLSPFILTLCIPVMCRAHASFRGMLSREIPAKTLLSSIAWVFTHSLSITQPLQLNPTINTRYKKLNKITIKFGTELKPTKHIVVNYNFTWVMSYPSLSLPVLVRLLPRGDLGLYLYLYLFYCAYMFNSLGICALILYLDLLDCCATHACIFNSCRICAQVTLVFQPTRESRVKHPLGMMKDSPGSKIYWKVFMTHEGVFLVCSLLGMVTCEEVFGNVWSTRENSSFSSWLTGELVLILPTRWSCLFHGEISLQLIRGLPSCLKPAREFFHDTILY